MTPALAAAPWLLILTLCYVALCAVSPFGLCRKCRGFGFEVVRGRFTGRAKRGKDCRRCRGHGRRIRFGRWLYHRAARLRRDASR